MEAVEANRGGERILLRLTEPAQRDLFRRFCEDVVEATGRAETEQHAVAQFVARTWRWHRLLRTGRLDRLSDQEQKGLIGELEVLRLHLVPALGGRDAVGSWVGPLDAPHDFEVGRIRIESKARGSGSSRILVSAATQLDAAPAEPLYLHVTQVVSAPEVESDALTVTEHARRLRLLLDGDDPLAADQFEERLYAAGFDWRHDYSDRAWIAMGVSLHEVREGFPRITSAMCPEGVENVRYGLNLAACDGLRLDSTALADELRRATLDG